MRINAGVGDLVRMIGDDQEQVGYCGQTMRGRVTVCVIHVIHVEVTRSAGFRFSHKTDGDSLSMVWLQNHCDDFLVCASKPRSMVWWFESQNHRDGFLIWASKPSRRRFVDLRLKTDERMKTVWGHTLTFGGLLCHEASWGRVSQFYHKMGEGAMAGDARGIITAVTWKWSKRRSAWRRRVQRSESRTKLPFISCNFHFSP
jgi:hypothetical protein